MAGLMTALVVFNSQCKEAWSPAIANQLSAKSVTDELIRYNALEKWNGAYPQTLMGGKTDGLILNLPDAVQ